ncbi:MAG: zinc metallopeptidase [Clostridia bacterium]|nr:zinc metallopeptidase [Clostridia bacterium]MBR7033693.1 zinc metallopeptidase [Clostridia bacterium]
MPYFYGFDWTYLVFVIPAIILSLWAQIKVSSTFKKYSAIPSDGGLTGSDAARMVLEQNGVTNVRIVPVRGNLTDHFDPKENVIRLSETVYDAKTAAAVGVAAHEAGHAAQYAHGYFPIKIRTAIIPISKIGSTLALPLVIIGLIFSWYPLAYAGVILFGAAVLFQLITLPVEFNASRRAVECLSSSGRVSGDGLKASKKVLTAAAMTYVAALFVALGNMIRLILIVGRRK